MELLTKNDKKLKTFPLRTMEYLSAVFTASNASVAFSKKEKYLWYENIFDIRIVREQQYLYDSLVANEFNYEPNETFCRRYITFSVALLTNVEVPFRKLYSPVF